MRTLCLLLCASLFLLTACRKKRDAAAAAPAASAEAIAKQAGDSPANSQAPMPPPASGTSPAMPASISAQDFSKLSQALLTFRRDKQRSPKDWQELIATGYLKQLPVAPLGKRYMFHPVSLDVHMVNQ